jgi:hypothetical protein
VDENVMGILNWEEIYRRLPKPQLSYFYQKQSDVDYLRWINCQGEDLRSLSYLWLYDLITLELEIRRAVAEAKSLKGTSFTNHPSANHQPLRYHADNACYRIFAAMDKVGQLLNMYLALKVDRPDFKKVIETLTERSDLKDISELLQFIKIRDADWYKSLSEYRHSLTHRLSPACESQEPYKTLLKHVSRFLEFKPIGYTLDQLDNLISDGHQNIVTIIEQCEVLLSKVPCKI